MEIATLVCWHCGEEASIEIPRQPQFAFEVAQMANHIGWVGAIDMNRHRTLVFCSEECSEAEKTKAGNYRLRPKGRN